MIHRDRFVWRLSVGRFFVFLFGGHTKGSHTVVVVIVYYQATTRDKCVFEIIMKTTQFTLQIRMSAQVIRVKMAEGVQTLSMGTRALVPVDMKGTSVNVSRIFCGYTYILLNIIVISVIRYLGNANNYLHRVWALWWQGGKRRLQTSRCPCRGRLGTLKTPSCPWRGCPAAGQNLETGHLSIAEILLKVTLKPQSTTTTSTTIISDNSFND